MELDAPATEYERYHGCPSELANQRPYQLPLKKLYAHLLGPRFVLSVSFPILSLGENRYSATTPQPLHPRARAQRHRSCKLHGFLSA